MIISCNDEIVGTGKSFTGDCIIGLSIEMEKEDDKM
jgi:hypothetical protein